MTTLQLIKQCASDKSVELCIYSDTVSSQECSLISELTHVKILRLLDCEVGSLKFLSSLELVELYLTDTTVYDLTIGNQTKLKVLGLSNTCLQDISPLQNLGSVEVLYLSENMIEDFTPLLGLKSLRYLEIEGNYGDGYCLKDHNSLEILHADFLYNDEFACMAGGNPAFLLASKRVSWKGKNYSQEEFINSLSGLDKVLVTAWLGYNKPVKHPHDYSDFINIALKFNADLKINIILQDLGITVFDYTVDNPKQYLTLHGIYERNGDKVTFTPHEI